MTLLPAREEAAHRAATADEPPRGWRIGALAKSLGVAPSTLYREVHRGRLPAVRMGQAVSGRRSVPPNTSFPVI